MKDFAYYSKISVPYPSRDSFTVYHVYKGGKVLLTNLGMDEFIQSAQAIVSDHMVMTFPSCSIREFTNLLAKYGYIVEKEVKEKAFKERLAAYNAEENRLHNEFVADLYEELGVKDNPKADKAFALAWDYGHSSGYSSVCSYFVELVELIK